MPVRSMAPRAYEEAAGQGILAGINAARKAAGGDPFVPSRSESYLGILVDDLVTQDVDEPYRMFTSRAECRLLLRIDNADRRLMPHGHRLGLVSPALFDRFRQKWERIDNAIEFLRKTRLKKASRLLEELRVQTGAPRGACLDRLLKRPEVDIRDMTPILRAHGHHLSREEGLVVQTQIRYEGYIRLQMDDVRRLKNMEGRTIPSEIDFDRVNGLSLEMKERLERVRPTSLGQASRIPGITPAALSMPEHSPRSEEEISGAAACHRTHFPSMSRFSKCVSSFETLFGLTLDPVQRNGIRTYIRLLVKWNSRVNLTRVVRTEDMLRFHFFESFWLAHRFLEPRHAVLDVGSGAGFPGLAMELYCPSLSLTLIEKNFKKTVFLKEVARTLSLRARIIHGEAETDVEWEGIRVGHGPRPQAIPRIDQGIGRPRHPVTGASW